MEFLKYESLESVGTLYLQRPGALNALNRALLREFSQFLEDSVRKGDMKVLILAGSGERAFAAGADIKEMRSLTRDEMSEYCFLGQKVVNQLKAAPFASIAAVHGFALGGGLEIALGCDFIYASQDAKLGLPEVSLGLVPGFGGISNLIEAIGMRRAKELILSGRPLNAEEAYTWGIVNRICHPKQLIEDCRRTAEKIADNSSFAVPRVKQAMVENYSLSPEDRLSMEKELCAECLEHGDFQKRSERFVK